MENEEKIAIQRSLGDLLDDLDPNDILPHLFQHFFLERYQYEELTEITLTRLKLCQRFLNIITSDSSCCTFQGLLDALRYKDAYPFLADKLEANLTEHNEIGAVGQTGNRQRQDEPRDEMQPTERSREGLPPDERTRDNLPLLEQVGKIDVFKENRTKMSRLAHRLKRLSHDGDVDKFRRVVSKINKQFSHDKLNASKDIEARMELADMKFVALEAQASTKRVSYDVTLYGNPLFDDMESMIPYTSNPRVSSMTFLARYGSAVSMLESLDNGLAILQYSKHHAEHVVPCKETGMVYYIEVNLLSQKYEKEPNTDLKMKILKTAELAMSQFTSEDEDVQKDYHRMLMLKMVFCRLGIGLFGNTIDNIAHDDTDAEAAKECLDFIERKDVWKGMEKRRKMLYHVAKSELYRQREQYELAIPHAIVAVNFATESNWKAELPNLERRLVELKDASKPIEQPPPVEFDDIDEWLNELEDECPHEMEELKHETNQNTNMEVLKFPNGQENESLATIQMMNLKLARCLDETRFSSNIQRQGSSLKSLRNIQGEEHDHNMSIGMPNIGEDNSEEVFGTSALEMDTLKGVCGIQETGHGLHKASSKCQISGGISAMTKMELLKPCFSIESVIGTADLNTESFSSVRNVSEREDRIPL